MADLFWPGDERAEDLFTEEALLGALARVEAAWLEALVGSGIAPAGAGTSPGTVPALVEEGDLVAVATGAESGGNPVIGLVKLLRARLEESGRAEAARWLHRGLTSQDVVDTALALCLADAVDRVLAQAADQGRALAGLVRAHRRTVTAGRTLTQHAVPTTFGLKAAGWLDGLTEATRLLGAARDRLAVQLGGAAGTLAAPVELARGDVAAVLTARRLLADRLGLREALPWHTERGTLTAAADALVGLADLWGRIGGDVAVRVRPEVGELREPAGEGRGGSSTMPHKANPVLSVLLRRHALAAPQLAATLHTAAGAYVDERPDGAWHAEWDALRTLGRHSAVAASQATELLSGLHVDADRMRRTAEDAAEALLAEQHSMAKLAGTAPATSVDAYLGANDALIDAALDRAATLWKDL